MKQDKTKSIKIKYLYFLMGFLLGVMFGAVLVWKIEINTINQAMDSLTYCYETYRMKC